MRRSFRLDFLASMPMAVVVTVGALEALRRRNFRLHFLVAVPMAAAVILGNLEAR